MALTKPMKRFFQVAAVALVLMGVTSGIFFWQAIENIRHQKRMANQEETQKIPK